MRISWLAWLSLAAASELQLPAPLLQPASLKQLGVDTAALDFHTEKLPTALAQRNLSTKCMLAVREYSQCQVINYIFLLCSNKPFLNDPQVQQELQCADGPSDPNSTLTRCRNACLLGAKALVNRTITGACNPQTQAMQGFSARISFFEMGTLNSSNFTESAVLPFPNVKGLGAISMIDFGYPGKCAQIPSAQYCVVAGKAGAKDAALVYSLGNCLPNACSEDELKLLLRSIVGAAMSKQMNVQCGLVEPEGTAVGMSKQVEDILGWGGIPVKYPRQQPVTAGFVLTMVCVCIFVLLVIAGSVVEWRRESKQRLHVGLESGEPLSMEGPELPPMKGMEAWLQHWSALRNGRSFLRTRMGDTNPFACMDAIRTISMAQVILGHMYVYATSSSGIANMEQFNPPNGMLGSVWFMMVPGCFYGVDSFFLLSGFLCCYGLQKKVFNKESNRKFKGFSIMYVKFIVLRVVRLLPLEMFCIALCVNVLPQLGTGVLWNLNSVDGHHCFEGAGAAGCDKYWWTNLLFIQDLDQYVGKCFAHTWYLANDMQLYLTAPFFSLAYSHSRIYGWVLISMGLLVGVVSPMFICARDNIVPDPLLGGADYMQKVYMKPYCRCTPFFVGIVLAWLWQEKLEKFNFRHTTCGGRITSYCLSLIAVAICAFCIFGRVVFYQCDIASCASLDANPGGRIGFLLWGGFSILGWSIGLGMIMILCFQKRFLPLLQNVLDLPGWQPFAKLSYASYLVHTSVLIMDYCQLDSPLVYSNSQFFFNYVAFVTVTMAAAFCLYILLEKPLANVQAAVFKMSE